MNFRRQPFQFTAIDPAKRQAELQKRFGLPTNNSDMFVDILNPSTMGSGIKEPLSSGSPRLQHRVPIFSEKAEKISEQNNVDGGHKPKVRIVPIQVEGVDGIKRHRTHSGPASLFEGCNGVSNGKLRETFPHLDSSKVEEKVKQSHPRVCNIPVQIEPREEQPKVKQNPEMSEPVKKLKSESNGCSPSKEKREDPAKCLQLKQIEKILNKLNEYKEEVEKFSGTSKDKQYRYLDEMLTRCMLDLDNVDTMGLDEIRKARKEAVRQVQHFVDLLDTKVNMDAEKIDSDLTTVANSDITTSTENELADSKAANPSTVVETNSANFNDSEFKIQNENVTGDVEMTEERTIDTMKDSPNESMEVSTIDEPVENLTESSSCQQEDVIKSPILKVEMEESEMCKEDQLEMKDGTEIVIEELDNNLESETNNSVSDVIEYDNSHCIVSHSPELSVKETIAEEGDSEIVIEELECDDGIQDNGDNSSNSCDSSFGKLDNDKKLTGQLDIKDNCSETNITQPVVQENIESEKL